jgi:hypothetical protein
MPVSDDNSSQESDLHDTDPFKEKTEVDKNIYIYKKGHQSSSTQIHPRGAVRGHDMYRL